MPEFIFTMQGVTRVHPPDKKVLENITLAFYPGAKIGVLGINGSGKSSLLKIMAGVDQDFIGEAKPYPGTKIGYFAQEPDLGSATTVKQAVDEAVGETKALLDEFEAISMKLGEPMSDDEMTALLEKQGKLQDQIDAADAWNLDTNVEIAMEALRLPPPDAEISKLSGGEKRRVALCRILLGRPDMLLLDEPTNHLDAESVAWLERFLQEYPGTVVAVTHDRYFLDNVAGWILELDRGRGYPFKGNYSAWLEQKTERLAQEEKSESARQRKLKQELEWVRASPKARQAKSKARLQAYDELMNQSSSKSVEGGEISIPPGPRLGDDVIEAEGLAKAFGDRVLFEGLDFRLPRAGIVGIIGPNGAGKTTLFRMLVGEQQPDQGELKVGETVQISYVDQSREEMGTEKTVFDVISGGNEVVEIGKREVKARAYCSWFGFRGSDQQKPVGKLSGGERNRVHLAKLLKQGGNVLLLDEPTNDLDVETLQSLEQALLDFPGCAVVTSHDRWFLDRIATHILAFEGDSQAVWFEGNFEAYEADRRRRLGEDADQPRRIKYRAIKI
ncbi:MAG: energy-dependent translational throttle protein EttA [Polyangiaceae bacterium]|nr:energy-dependent translational throttle protein EttA [Myxococcales bacterium]MCB9587851.1 energy-dependent translational throttle protein EttA [Polyangiaceae bacterium]MCB9608800.1 energy-dependent translational throttle protein EttA [Polyangiaceae bacterium]